MMSYILVFIIGGVFGFVAGIRYVCAREEEEDDDEPPLGV